MAEKKVIDLEVLMEIIKILKDNDLSEICIEQNGVKIKVKQEYAQPVSIAHHAVVPAVHEEAVGSGKEKLDIISAPLVGTFYRSPSPDVEPYVEVGDEVEAGQVLCIIEAMKMMNEITADFDCEIVEILVKNGQQVEYNTPLFRVRPTS